VTDVPCFLVVGLDRGIVLVASGGSEVLSRELGGALFDGGKFVGCMGVGRGCG
jgi:hypothetical protein